MRYAFTFDASACTGCKSCQVACKDKNDLPVGVLWRRVYEVSGGTWQRQGAAWTNDVFAYNVSVGCNHCDAPACASVCPTGAYFIRPDGIVCQDQAKCIGCEYCTWACPYSAPQYSAELGRTTKCDFCCDLLDEGLQPACVSACPMRALDFTRVTDGERVGPGLQSLWTTAPSDHPFPLPSVPPTQPRLAVKPHRAMLNDLPKAVANLEEVRPTTAATATAAARLQELPLVAFTLLGQTAAGLALMSLLTGSRSVPLLVTIGALLAAGVLVSLLHLGMVSQAWRAPAHLKTSALSREIVMVLLFAAAWMVALVAPRIGQIAMAITGGGLVYSMSEVYTLEAVPGWKTWRTRAAFASSALLLGALMVLVLFAPTRLWLSISITAAAAAGAAVSRWRFYKRISAKSM